MAFETEALLDRRRLRRRVSAWRVAAVIAAIIAVGALGFRGGRGAFSDERQVARMTIDGLITDNREQLRLLKRLADNNSVQAVIVSINSPGGTTSGGEALYEAIRGVAAKKPIIAQFGTIATSAGYICGLATDHIFARGNTITGSVGVIFQWADVSELLTKLGVKMNEVKSGPLKANPSPFQPMDSAGRETAEKMVAESMSWFKGLVAMRRQIDTSQVPGLEQGRIFSGREALGFKLIDAIGGEAEVQKYLEESRGVAKGLRVVDWRPKGDDDWSVRGLVGRIAGAVLGVDAARLSAMLGDSRVAALQLDGLISIWHAVEK